MTMKLYTSMSKRSVDNIVKVRIFFDFGCEVFEEDGKYYIYYDSGESSG